MLAAKSSNRSSLKQARLNRVAHHLKQIELNLGDTADAWISAYHYLNINHIDTYFLTAVGIDTGKHVKEWMNDYYVSDENAGAKVAHKIAQELSYIEDDAVYLSNQGLDAYNQGSFTPNTVEEADSCTIQEAFYQMIQSLHDFPERY